MTDTPKVTRKDIFNIMQLFETQQVQEVNEDDFEDLTQAIFDAVDNQLKDNEMICSPDFDFEETMTSFELMDDKMDIRKGRHELKVKHKELLRSLDEGAFEPLSVGRKIAFMRELFLQFATQQQCIANLQQTVYSCLTLSKKEYYTRSSDIFAFVEALQYIICTNGRINRTSAIFRDEDICFPATFDAHHDCEPKDIFNRLAKVIETIEKTPKTGSKSQDKTTKDFQKCFKLI